MAKTTSNTSSNTSSDKTPAICRTCLHAKLHRYDNNPLLAACQCKPQPDNERFPFEIELANTPRKCESYSFDPSEKEIEQRYRSAV